MSKYLNALPLSEGQRRVVDEVVRFYADQGRIIEGGWRAYRKINEDAEMPLAQIADQRRVFFLGAQHVFASVISMLEPGLEPTEQDLARMTKLHEELEAFRRSLGN